MTGTEQKKSSNKIMIIVIVVIAVAGIGIFAMSEQNTVTTQDAKDLVSDIKTDAENIDPGYGQVTKQDGAYSP